MYGSQTQRPTMSRAGSRAPQANAYQSNSIMTATPGKLLLMLYDGAIKFCNIAEEAIDKKDIIARNTNLVKAQDILTELRITIDEKPYPEFANKMKSLYIFYEKELMIANIESDKRKIAWVKNQLADLRDTWAKVV